MNETPLAIIIKKRGLKKTWLADQAEISRAAMSLLVQGKTDPTLKTARKIAKVLGVSIEELWPDTDSGDANAAE